MSYKGIVTRVITSKYCPEGKVMFVRDITSHPEAFGLWRLDGPDEEVPDGIIVVIPPGQPLVRELADSLIGRVVDVPSQRELAEGRDLKLEP